MNWITKYLSLNEATPIHNTVPRVILLLLTALGIVLVGLTITNVPIVYSEESSDGNEGNDGDNGNDGNDGDNGNDGNDGDHEDDGNDGDHEDDGNDGDHEDDGNDGDHEDDGNTGGDFDGEGNTGTLETIPTRRIDRFRVQQLQNMRSHITQNKEIPLRTHITQNKEIPLGSNVLRKLQSKNPQRLLRIQRHFTNILYGINAVYPSNWRIDETDNNPKDTLVELAHFYPSSGTDKKVEIGVDDQVTSDLTLERYLESITDVYQNNLGGINVLESGIELYGCRHASI